MPLVVLDRDGVINHESKDFVRTPDEWRPLPGSLEAIAALSRGGWNVAVATNQSGVARGLFDEATLSSIHSKMRDEISRAGGQLGHIVFCPHAPDAGCPCRKPRAGLLNQLSTIYSTATADMVVVGDSARDVEAARSVGARAFLVRTGNGRATEASVPEGVVVADDLLAVSRLLLTEAAS